jgi:hypothetical protein
MSHSCHTDICSTVRRFSRLLLHKRVISERKSFFTSSSCSVCFDCRMSVATTFSITAKRRKEDLILLLLVALYREREREREGEREREKIFIDSETY